MKCPYCGKKISTGMRSCESCGNYLGESFKGETSGASKKASSMKWVLLALILFLLALGVALAFFAINWR